MIARVLRGTGLSSLLWVVLGGAACSASGTSAGGDDGAGAGTSAGGTSAGASAAGASAAGSSAAGTSGASSGAAGTGGDALGGAAGSGGETHYGGAGPTTNATCLPGITPGDPQTAPVTATGPGAPVDAENKFGGAVDGTISPKIIYPNDQTLVPPNINTLDVHFLPGGHSSLFEIRFANQAVDYRFYTSCTQVNEGCVATVDGTSWTQLASLAQGSGPMTLTIRGVDTGDLSRVGVSDSRVLEIAPDPVLGGLYYWNAGGAAIIRYDFGNPAGVAEQYYTTSDSGTVCVGCHSLSRKGNRIAVGLSAPIMEVPLRILDVATKKPIIQIPGPNYKAGSSYQAFSPDETEILVSDGSSLTSLDVMTGMPKGPVPLVKVGTMADFVPDGSGLVYAKPATPPCNGFICIPGISGASLAYMPRTGGVWGDEQILVPSGMNNYYPSVSPDGQTVLFNHSAGSPGGSDQAPDAALWAVSIKGGAPFELARANSTGGSTSNSWPKFAPFHGCGGEIMWFTFSSNRDFGLRIENGQKGSDAQTWQLWMGAFNHTKAMQGEDPSFAAFWLPFQDPATGNHIAQWVEKVQRKSCMTDDDCTEVTVTGQKLGCSGGYCAPM